MEKKALNLILITLCIVFGGIIIYDMMKKFNIVEGLTSDIKVEEQVVKVPEKLLEVKEQVVKVPEKLLEVKEQVVKVDTEELDTEYPKAALSTAIPIIDSKLDNKKTKKAQKDIILDETRLDKYLATSLETSLAISKALESRITNENAKPVETSNPLPTNILPISSKGPLIKNKATISTQKGFNSIIKK